MTPTPAHEPLAYRADLSAAASLARGEFCYRRDDYGRPKWLFFWPRSAPAAVSAAIAPQRNGMGVSWTLTGTDDRPTLNPFVSVHGVWRGYLTDGLALP